MKDGFTILIGCGTLVPDRLVSILIQTIQNKLQNKLGGSTQNINFDKIPPSNHHTTRSAHTHTHRQPAPVDVRSTIYKPHLHAM